MFSQSAILALLARSGGVIAYRPGMSRALSGLTRRGLIVQMVNRQGVHVIIAR